MTTKWKFAFYGWLIVIIILVNLAVKLLVGNIGLVGIPIVFGAGLLIYAKAFKKSISDTNFWLNAIVSYIIVIVVFLFVAAAAIATLISTAIPTMQ